MGMVAFMNDSADSTAGLARDFSRMFDDYRSIADQDPTSNPLLRLALEVSNRLETGALNYDAVGDLVQHLTVTGFETRAAKLGRYSGETDPERNTDIVRQIAWDRTRAENGE